MISPESFERLYAEHAESLLGFLAYRTGDRTLAEDLVADTFERVLRARWRFDPRKSSEKTWIYTIALNCLRDQGRRRGAEARAVDRAAQPVAVAGHVDDGGFGSVDDRSSVMQALEVLTAEERESISLRYGADLTMPEISKLLGERVSTIEGRIYRALKKLRQQIT